MRSTPSTASVSNVILILTLTAVATGMRIPEPSAQNSYLDYYGGGKEIPSIGQNLSKRVMLPMSKFAFLPDKIHIDVGQGSDSSGVQAHRRSNAGKRQQQHQRQFEDHDLAYSLRLLSQIRNALAARERSRETMREMI